MNGTDKAATILTIPFIQDMGVVGILADNDDDFLLEEVSIVFIHIIFRFDAFCDAAHFKIGVLERANVSFDIIYGLITHDVTNWYGLTDSVLEAVL